MFKKRYWVIIVLILGGGAGVLAYNSGGNEPTVDWQKNIRNYRITQGMVS